MPVDGPQVWPQTSAADTRLDNSPLVESVKTLFTDLLAIEKTLPTDARARILILSEIIIHCIEMVSVLCLGAGHLISYR